MNFFTRLINLFKNGKKKKTSEPAEPAKNEEPDSIIPDVNSAPNTGTPVPDVNPALIQPSDGQIIIEDPSALPLSAVSDEKLICALYARFANITARDLTNVFVSQYPSIIEHLFKNPNLDKLTSQQQEEFNNRIICQLNEIYNTNGDIDTAKYRKYLGSDLRVSIKYQLEPQAGKSKETFIAFSGSVQDFVKTRIQIPDSAVAVIVSGRIMNNLTKNSTIKQSLFESKYYIAENARFSLADGAKRYEMQTGKKATEGHCYFYFNKTQYKDIETRYTKYNNRIIDVISKDEFNENTFSFADILLLNNSSNIVE